MIKITEEQFKELKNLSSWIFKQHSKLFINQDDYQKGILVGRIQHDIIKLYKTIRDIDYSNDKENNKQMREAAQTRN